jgi:hypothetical protein
LSKEGVLLRTYRIFLIAFLASLSSEGLSYQYVTVGSGGIAVPIHGNFFSVGARPTTRHEIEVSGYLADHKKDNVDIRYSYYSFRYKRFVGKSLYYAPGFGQRLIRGKLTDDDELYEASRSIDSYGAELTVGNQWQNGRIRFGVDWIGYFHPVMSTTTQSGFRYKQSGKSFAVSGNTPFLKEVRDYSEREWNNSLWDRLAQSGNLIFMRLQFGYIF